MDRRRRALSASTMSGGINTYNYLTIVALEDGLTAQLSLNECEYCVDGDGDWKTLTAATNTEAINTGQTLSFRGNLTPNSSNGIGTFTISKSCNLQGNCMSMLFGDDAASNTSLSGKNNTFRYLFQNCTTIKSVSSGFLPATTIASGCYEYMFQGCTNLTQAPELPATILMTQCYYSMFRYCTILTKAPELPATNLADNCYGYMFESCTSLTKAPELSATTLVYYCYNSMFSGCTNLTQVQSILPATTLAIGCCSSMFWKCTNLTTAPELPATTLLRNCYNSMFRNCTKLNYVKAMFTTTPSSEYTSNWLDGVASTGTFVKNRLATWNVTGSNGIPEGWAVANAITFTIDRTEYQAEEGMTWGEWVNSEYNMIGAYIDSSGLIRCKESFIESSMSILVYEDELILPGESYTISDGGHSGGSGN